jgi:tetratricopeptide (TPR) repeat protein
VAARIELANVLYDTGNWSEAIVHYRSAERLDPQRSTTVVDMGVCYYNLSAFAAAESLFTRALAIDPKQIFALFNLGIVAESRADWNAAIDYFHRVMELNPPEGMRPIVEQHLQAAMEKDRPQGPAARGSVTASRAALSPVGTPARQRRPGFRSRVPPRAPGRPPTSPARIRSDAVRPEAPARSAGALAPARR